MFIYLITNELNGKQYVGQTIQSLRKRFLEHCRSGKSIHLAIKKYGRQNFSIKTLDTALCKKELSRKEAFWIKELKSMAPNGYNLTAGGEEYELTESTKEKIRLTKMGIKNPMFGIPSPFKNKKHSEESLVKMRKKRSITHKHTKEHSIKKVLSRGVLPIKAIHVETGSVVWEGLSRIDCAKVLNCFPQNVSRALKIPSRTINGHIIRLAA